MNINRVRDSMDITDVLVNKQDKRGTVFDCDNFKLIKRVKGSVTGDHQHYDSKVYFLLSGEAEVSVGDQTRIISGLKRINVPKHAYHKILALTDVELAEYKY